MKDRTLRSGERQIAPTLAGIEKWHKWRYEQARDLVEAHSVVDLGCGCGYGSKILSIRASRVLGIDDSEDAIKYANKHWSAPNISYSCQDVLAVEGRFDCVVAFEIIEHIEDTDIVFDKIAELSDKVILSVPDISVPLSRSNFHYRHFSKEDVLKYLLKRKYHINRLEMPQFSKGLAIFCVAEK
jgi:2-polyprenyl-3-methyl-5-hydroxy-6-metoxy-1,4-benzoquinol methylase